MLGLATIYVLTRVLDAEQYGLYALGMAGVNIVAAVLFQWLNTGIARLYAAHSDSLPEFFSEAGSLYKMASGTGLFFLVGWLIMRPKGVISAEISVAIGLGGLAMGAYNMHLQVHNAQLQTYRYGILSISRAALVLILGALASVAGYGAVGAIFGVALGCAITVILFGYQRPKARKDVSNSKIRRQIVSYGIPLALTYAATIVIDVSDRFLISWKFGPSSVGGYSASYDLAQQTVGVILNVFFLAAFPRITAAWEIGGDAAARQPVTSLARVLLMAAGASAGVFIGLSADIAHLMFGPGLSGAATHVIPWVASAIAIGCLKGYLFDIALQLDRRTSTQLRITFAMALINILLNLILLPSLGVLGAAVAAFFAFCAGAIMSYHAGSKVNLIPPIGADIIKTLVSLALMVLFLSSLNEFLPTATTTFFLLPMKIGTGIAVFALASALLNLAGIRDILLARVERKEL